MNLQQLLQFIRMVNLQFRSNRFDGMPQIQVLISSELKPSVPPTEPQSPTAGRTVLKGQPARLLRVKGSRTLLISAYLEHRTTKKEVRVIAIKLRREKVVLQCLLRCQDQQLVSEAAIRIHRDHFRFPYGTADVLCPVPSGCEAPTHVAIAPAPIKDQEKSELEFLEIKNQKALNNSFPHNFTCCFSAMYNFTNVLQLVQSLEMLQFLGVNRVVVYKTNCSADVQRVLDHYSEKGLVEVIPWSLSKYLNVSRKASPQQSPGDIHYFGQIPALNDCLYRFMYRSRYVALHDPDELILPQTVGSWMELLPLLKKKYGADRCYTFENNWIPMEFELPPPKPNALPAVDQWQNVSGVNILAHLYREPFIPRRRQHNAKIIVNPRAVFATSVHGVLQPQKSCIWVDRKLARMYHIKPRGPPKHKEKQLIYEGRLLGYSSHLIPAVNAVLKQTGLLPEAT
uniref:Glycosyltransferase family 92 protein n=1 Tax=Poecilia formosa TaxID=48698 RepID=A0A096LQY2_POEFO